MQKISLIDLLLNYRFNNQVRSINTFLEIIKKIDSRQINDEESYFSLQSNATSEDGFLIKFSPSSNLYCGLTFEVSPVYQTLFIAFDKEKLVELMYSGADLKTALDVILQILKSPITLTIETNNSTTIINKIYNIVNMENEITKYRIKKSFWNRNKKIISNIHIYESWI